MLSLPEIIEAVKTIEHGFSPIRNLAQKALDNSSAQEALVLAEAAYQSEIYQVRMFATFLWGYLAQKEAAAYSKLRDVVSKDADWRVQEILAQAFDIYCAAIGYEKALPTIQEWLSAENPNLRRAASEGLRIWTSRPYFKQHPEIAVNMLSQCKADASEYVRKSIGNALRDISRKHPELVKAELENWNQGDKATLQTYKLASKFLPS
jgi:3-methyladenine DNA glycosylase AlkD